MHTPMRNKEHLNDCNKLSDPAKAVSRRRNAGRRNLGAKKFPATRKTDGKAKGTPPADTRKSVIAKMPESVDLRRLASEGNLLVSVDDTYETAIIYLYCLFREYTEVHKRLYKSDDMPKREAIGYCSFGESSKKKCNIALIWINAVVEKRLTIPTAVHEISHAVDDILAGAGVRDSSGETRAYMVERETRRLLEEFYGIGTNRLVTEKKVLECLK